MLRSVLMALAAAVVAGPVAVFAAGVAQPVPVAPPQRTIPQADPGEDGRPHTYVQKFNARGDRYASEQEAAADMEIVSQRIRSAGYVILNSFVVADVDDPDHRLPWNNYRFEISYIAPHGAHVDPSKIPSLKRLDADPDDCQVLNPEFCQ